MCLCGRPVRVEASAVPSDGSYGLWITVGMADLIDTWTLSLP